MVPKDVVGLLINESCAAGLQVQQVIEVHRIQVELEIRAIAENVERNRNKNGGREEGTLRVIQRGEPDRVDVLC